MIEKLMLRFRIKLFKGEWLEFPSLVIGLRYEGEKTLSIYLMLIKITIQKR